MRLIPRTPLLLLAAIACPAAGQPSSTTPGDIGIEPVPLCQLVPNGSFHNGFTRWMRDACPAGFGDYCAGGNFSIFDFSWDPACDADVACIGNYSCAQWTADKPSGSAGSATYTLATKTTVTGRFLRFKTTGGFEFIIWGGGQVNYDVLVRVTNEDGIVHECPVLDGSFGCGDFDLECGTGIQALGIIPQEVFCCDVTSNSGIQVGDTVTIEYIFSSNAFAAADCDIAEFFGSACIDNVQFCNACIIPAPYAPQPIDVQPLSDRTAATLSHDAERGRDLIEMALATPARPDVNRDGVVSLADAEALAEIIAYGASDLPQYDLDGNGTLDSDDVATVLEQLNIEK